MRSRGGRLAATGCGLIALLGAACGAVEEQDDAEKRRPTMQATSTTGGDDLVEAAREQGVDVDEEASGWAWVTLGSSAAVDSDAPPLVEQLAVFSGPRRTADAVPPAALELAEARSSKSDEYEGQELLNQSRLALSDAGSRSIDIYLAPTTKGFVCKYVVDPTDELAGGDAGCDHALSDGYTMQMSGTGNRLEVEGLVEDSVRRVEIEVWGRRMEADVGGNAYYLDTTLDRSCPEAVDAIILHSLRGARRIELDPMVPPPGAGTPRIPGCR
jgi:hypothetical protein